MTRSIAIARTVVLVAGVVQLVLGLLFWGGIGLNLVPLHITVGSLLVLALWVEAFLCARAGAPIALVVLVFVWGLIVPFLGIRQTEILVGSSHWIIQAVHLLFGLIAMGLASIIAGTVRRRATVPA